VSGYADADSNDMVDDGLIRTLAGTLVHWTRVASLDKNIRFGAYNKEGRAEYGDEGLPLQWSVPELFQQPTQAALPTAMRCAVDAFTAEIFSVRGESKTGFSISVIK
jgi:hypothetical protein